MLKLPKTDCNTIWIYTFWIVCLQILYLDKVNSIIKENWVSLVNVLMSFKYLIWEE